VVEGKKRPEVLMGSCVIGGLLCGDNSLRQDNVWESASSGKIRQKWTLSLSQSQKRRSGTERKDARRLCDVLKAVDRYDTENCWKSPGGESEIMPTDVF
jgi:hypothetical protein